MNAYEMDDYPTWYAAHSEEEAVRLYTSDCGERVEDGYPRLVSDAELDAEVEERDENEALTGKKVAPRVWLNAMTAPGFLCSAL